MRPAAAMLRAPARWMKRVSRLLTSHLRAGERLQLGILAQQEFAGDDCNAILDHARTAGELSSYDPRGRECWIRKA